MKTNRIGKLLYAYQTTVYFLVHEHSIKGIIKLENHYIPIQICRESIKTLKPIIIHDPNEKVYSESPFILPTPNKWTL
jgi:hypothetical protein